MLGASAARGKASSREGGNVNATVGCHERALGLELARCGPTWPDRAGQRRHTASMRRSNSEPVGHYCAMQFGHQSQRGSLTAQIGEARSPNLKLTSANSLNKSGSPTYHQQFLFKDQGLILNQYVVKSSQSQINETANASGLRNISKC